MEKFHLREDLIQKVIEAFRQFGIEVLPQPAGAILIDMDDLVFYEVAMESLLNYQGLCISFISLTLILILSISL